jgi:hypothetical protein
MYPVNSPLCSRLILEKNISSERLSIILINQAGGGLISSGVFNVSSNKTSSRSKN